MTGGLARPAALDALDGARVDVLVVGGGILGSRIAYEAARHGLRVALVDAGDFGGATSSASTKQIHGGLRYLARGDLRLVRQLQAERRALMTSIAPHLVRPVRLVLAVERDHGHRSAKLVAGLAVYAALSGSRHALPRLVRPGRAGGLVPSLDTTAVALCGLITEGQTHDARLTLATVRGAAAAGATALNYVRLVALRQARGKIVGAALHDVHGGRRFDVRCRAVVNATGPWIDHIRRLERPDARPLARLSKGVHAVLPFDRPWSAGLALFDDSRSALAVPWQGMLLVGASDAEHDGDPGNLTVHRAEIAALLAPLARLVDDRTLDLSRVVHAFAGLRVLPRGPGDSARAPRLHLIDTGPTGLISVAGGKLTTHRRIAVDVLRRLPHEIRPRRVAASWEPLPGADWRAAAGLLSRRAEPDVAAHLLHLYGGDARRVLAYAESSPDALDRLHAEGPDVLAQAWFACDEEHALTVDDIASRRTTLAVRGLAGEAERARIAEVLAGELLPSAPGARAAAR